MLDQQRSIINNRIPSKRGFKLASLNDNKLSTHVDEIRILLADKCPDVLAIPETKLDVSNNNSDFHICGYELTKLILLKLISLSKPMATRVKRGKSSTILHLVRPSIHRLEK